MWTPEYLRSHLEQFLAEFPDPDAWPRAVDFEDAGRADLRSAVKNYGGAKFWAREFGRQLDRRQDRSPYLDDDARADAQALIRKLGGAPGADKWRELGYSRLAGYFVRFEGGRRQALEHLGLPTALPRPAPPYSTREGRRRRRQRQAEREAGALAEARRLVADLGYMPGAHRLRGLGHNKLASYVNETGGVRAFARRHRLPL